MAAQNLIASLKRALASVEETSLDARGNLADGELSLRDQVEVGQILWRVVRLAQASLDPVKDSLRNEAMERCKGRPGRQFLSGRSRGSRCTVVVPPPEVRLRDGADVDALRRYLGTDFESFFKVLVQPRREFAERAVGSPEIVKELAQAVDTVSGKPRVTFND